MIWKPSAFNKKKVSTCKKIRQPVNHEPLPNRKCLIPATSVSSTNWPQLTLMSKSPASKVHHNSWLPSNFDVGASNVAHEKKINNFLNSAMSSIKISLSLRSDRFSILLFLLVGESRSLLPIYGIPRISPTSEQVIGNCLSCPMSNLQWAILKWVIIHLHKLCLISVEESWSNPPKPICWIILFFSSLSSSSRCLSFLLEHRLFILTSCKSK